MKKRHLVLLVFFLLLSGCQSTHESKDINQTVSKGETTGSISIETITETMSKSDDEWETPVKKIDFDLKGLSEYKDFQDHISFYIKHGEANSEFFKIQIGESSIVAPGNNLTGDFDVIALSEKLAVMAVSEVGPSGDDATSYFCYEPSGYIVFMGKLPGVVRNTIYNGDGTLITKKRGAILHTWWYDAVYHVNATNRFECVPEDLYLMNTPVKLLKALPIVKARDDRTLVKTLKIGEEAVILSSDDKRWCLIQATDRTQGWFEIDDHGIVKGTEQNSWEVFEGLNNAD